MLTLKTILVPVDFSERSVAAAEHAVHMANRFDSQLIFVHVVPPITSEYGTFGGGFFGVGATSKEPDIDSYHAGQMAALVKKVSLGRPIETLLLEGDPAHKIEQVVKERDVGLLMMPTHGYGPFRRFILGSVTAKVLHDVSCPVFTGAHVPEVAAFDPEPYKRVVCALDLREHSEAVLRWAWGFAQKWEADLIVLHAAPSVEAGATYGEFFPPESREVLIGMASKEVGKLIETVGCKAEVHVDSGSVISYSRKVVEDTYGDILIIGRTPEGGVLGRLRTHAYGLIRESPCPVISV